MQTNNEPISKHRRILGNVVVFSCGLLLVGSAAAKFAHVPRVVGQLGAMGFDGNRLMLIAVLETITAVLFLMRPARSAGLLLVSAFLGGAIATHIQHGHSPAQPIFFLSLLWLGTWLRHPEILWSVNRGHAPRNLGHSKAGERVVSGA
jgi:DoxX-like family